MTWIRDDLGNIVGREPETETTVTPTRLIAGTAEQARQALGRPLPAVVGTGRVTGVYFVGGVTQTDTTTTTTTWTSQELGEIHPGQVIGVAGPGGIPSYPVFTRHDESVTTSEFSVKAGYVLAYDFFGAGYDLLRLEINDLCVYDTERGIAAAETFRFYGGQHTSIDPILSQIIGVNAGAYKNFVMVFLDGYPADSPPSVSAVISKVPGLMADSWEQCEDPGIDADQPPRGPVTEVRYWSNDSSCFGFVTYPTVFVSDMEEGSTVPVVGPQNALYYGQIANPTLNTIYVVKQRRYEGEDQPGLGPGTLIEIDWTGPTPPVMGQAEAGHSAAYEPGSGVIYQVIASGTALALAVLDTYTHVERYRVPLEDTAGWSGFDRQVMCLRGTGHILLRVAGGGAQINRIYDVANGHIVAEYEEDVALDDYQWICGQKFGERYLLVGFDTKAGSESVVYGLADIAGDPSTGSGLTTGHIGSLTPTAASALAYGLVGIDSITFWFSNGTTVTDMTWDGDSWSTATRYTSSTAGSITATWFDPLTGYLVVIDKVSSYSTAHYINPVSGASIASYTITAPYYIDTNGMNATATERYWPKAGHVMMTRSLTGVGRIYVLDIASRAISIYAEDPAATLDEFNTGIFDQNRSLHITGIDDDRWTVHMRPGNTPLQISLSDVAIDVMSLAGFSAADLTFYGFDGIQAYGFVIESNTTIQTAMRTLSDIYGFTWCDTGSGFIFRKPATGDLLTVDAAFTASDIVERNPPVQSSDEADIRTPSAVEMDYVSKEGIYNPRPVSFSMTTGVLNSITTPRLSTPILLNDSEAQRICIEKFFEYQEKRRSHNLVVAPEFIEILPGDIVSFPSGSISYTAQVEQVGIDLRNLGVEISARDFQTEVETDVTSVSNQVATTGTVFQTSQYIHLNMPLYRYADDRQGTEIVQYGMLAPRGQALWSGATLYRGPVTTALVALFNQVPHSGVVGSCLDVLAAPVDPFAPDAVSTVTIRRLTFDDTLLVDATSDQVLAGTNNALIGEPGRWEWVGYENVTDNGDGTYTLSGFTFRGYRGSEVFCASHQIGDVFVTLGIWVKKSLHPLSDLRTTKYYKAVGTGQNAANVQAVARTITGTAETPYAPVNLNAVVGTPDGIDISWDYRSRITTGLNPAAHGEHALKFEIDIYGMDGTTYLRTLTSTINSVHYATADVLADFGADPPDHFYFRVFMMSGLPILVPGQDRPVQGRGYEARRHIVFVGGPMTADNTMILASSTLVTADAI